MVTKDVADYTFVYGNLARIQGWMCECGVKLEFKKSKAICKSCKKEFKKTKDKVQMLSIYSLK